MKTRRTKTRESKYPTTAQQRNALREAERLGLYLLFEDFGRRWLVYHKGTGKQLATFYPSEGKVLCSRRGFDFTALDERDALNRIRQQGD